MLNRLRRHLGDRARSWLSSQRPAWAMMPRGNACLLVDTLLTTVSVMEQAGVSYTAHQGSLLGATRLGGLLPWDVDADLAIIDDDAASTRAKLEAPLRAHGLSLIFCREHHYYTIRPFLELDLPGLARQELLLVPFIEVILITKSQDAQTGALWFDRHAPHRMFAPGELLPLRRYAWHTSYLLGPAEADPVLGRLYGEAGGGDALRRFSPATLDPECADFWARARPLVGDPDAAAILARASARRHGLRRQLACAPWYLANGLYSELGERIRRGAGGR